MSKILPSGLRFWPRSLRWRLQLWQGFLVVSMMIGFGLTIYQLQRINRFRQIDGDLQTRVTALSRAVREVYRDTPDGRHPPPDDMHVGDFRPPPPKGRMPDDRFGPGTDERPDPITDYRPPPRSRAPHPPDRPPVAVPLPTETAGLFGPRTGYYFMIWYRDGTVLNRSDNASLDSPQPSFPERDTLPHFRTRGEFREAVHCSGMGDCSMAGRSIDADLSASRAFGWTLLGAGAAVLAMGFGLGWWFIGRAIRPLEAIGNAATRIAGGNLSERIKIGDPNDELGRLASVLNSTFARLESAFLRQQQFTSDAAHELRTPLSILISEAQTTLARERTAAEYRETIEGSLETAQQMRKIAEMLLELARFDTADPVVSRGYVDLAAATARCIERLKPLTEPQGIAIRADLAPAAAFVVPKRFEVVIANLLTNAIHYNRRGGEVRVATYSDNAAAILEVSDTGIGIPAEDLPHIFDRFYRADKARSRAQGHAGLGLAICKTIVEAECGSIEVFSTLQKGTTFTVRLPARG